MKILEKKVVLSKSHIGLWKKFNEFLTFLDDGEYDLVKEDQEELSKSIKIVDKALYQLDKTFIKVFANGKDL